MLSLCLSVVGSGCGGRERPNILLVLLDDFGYNDLAIHNGSDSPTPVLDDLARSGIRFTRHYTESTCSPSRAALLTGRYAARVGFDPVGPSIPSELVTLPELLSEGGYRTHMVGKWHLGDHYAEARPDRHGFDDWLGALHPAHLGRAARVSRLRGTAPTYRDPWLENAAGERRQYRGHLTDILTDHAADFIRAADERPWFLYVAYFAPHEPIEPSKRYAAGFPPGRRGRYQALKAQVDAGIGTLLETLTESGQADDTLVVVASDNGGVSRRYQSNLPFAGAKSSYSEGGIRTPLIVHWPSHWEGGREVQRPVMIFDLYPTLAAAAGMTPPAELDGRDLLSEPPLRKLFWFSPSAFSALSEDGRWRLTEDSNGPRLLDATDLPTPEVDRSDQQPALAASLRAAFLDWRDGATRVRLSAAEARDGRRSFADDAFRRSPLMHDYTIGIALERNAGGFPLGETSLAVQEGYLSVKEHAGGLLIEFDGQRIPIALQPHRDCMSLAIAASLRKENMYRLRAGTKSSLSVFLDGVEVAALAYRHVALSPAPPSNPLVLLSDPRAALHVPADSEPVIHTRRLEADEIRDHLHRELISTCAGRLAGSARQPAAP